MKPHARNTAGPRATLVRHAFVKSVAVKSMDVIETVVSVGP